MELFVPRAMAASPTFTESSTSFSPLWIIGSLLALLAAIVIAVIVYDQKKRRDQNKINDMENEENVNDTSHHRIDNGKECSSIGVILCSQIKFLENINTSKEIFKINPGSHF